MMAYQDSRWACVFQASVATRLPHPEARVREIMLDPVAFTGSGGSDAQQAFAIYGALLTRNAETNEIDDPLGF